MRRVSAVGVGNGPTLSCAEQGDGAGPALVLLAGPTDSWWSYDPVLELIPPSIRALALSLRGHGDSDKPLTGYGVDDFAGDVIGVMDALRIDRAVLAGHSASCLVARRVAIDRPERVAGLILEASPTSLRDDAAFKGFVESVVSDLEDPIDPDFARSFVVGTSSDTLGAEMLDDVVDEVLKVPARVWREMFAGLLHYDDTAELGDIRAPTMLIWGDADALVGRDMQDELRERISTAELVVYAGVGHTPRWEDPSRFAAEVSAFVSRSLPSSS